MLVIEGTVFFTAGDPVEARGIVFVVNRVVVGRLVAVVGSVLL